MAQWRKVIVSGSNAELNQVSASGNFVPTTNNGVSLGTTALQFSDLFLAEGGVINFDSGDATITQTGNLINIEGGNTRVAKLELSDANNSLVLDTDVKIVANADIVLDPGGNNVKPGSDSADDLGVSGTAWRTLFVDSVDMNGQGNIIDVVNITGSGHVSMSHSSTGSFGRLETHGDAFIRGNLTFGDANTDSVSFGAEIDSNLIPNIDDTYDLGSSAKAWQDLFLEGDITLTDAGTVKTAAGALTIDGAAGVNIQEGSATVIAIDNSQNLVLNNISGKTVTIGHSTSETTVGDNLTVTGNASVGGNATITGNLDVNGTLTTIDTDNLRVKDQFIIVASGSTGDKDAGIIANTTGSGTGSAFFYDSSANRWALAVSSSVQGTATTATAQQYVTSVSSSAVDPSGAPNDFGNTDGVRGGMMYINTATGDIFIYS